MSQCYTQTEVVNELNALKTLVAAGTLHLAKAAFTPASGLTAATMNAIEANYDGYAAATLTDALAVYQNGANSWAFQVPTKQFSYGTPGTPPVTNTIYGMYVLDTGGNLIWSATLPTSFPMSGPLQALPIDLVFSKQANPF